MEFLRVLVDEQDRKIVRLRERYERENDTEVVINPDDPDLLYAGAWQRERRDWSWLSTGP